MSANLDKEDAAEAQGLYGLPGEGQQSTRQGRLCCMEVWIATTMLGLNPDDEFNEQDLNQRYRRVALLLHPDAAARKEVSLEEATAMFQ